ncbi:MAG: alpha/beta fold hydrolase [Candidatus Aminicenantes bacterium]|nr:MAG: alpha/beta fold hydrolase [Candidatus Aminicenantes bacterium]
MERKIYFLSSKGHKLCGILSDPSGDKRRPLIVMCHGFTTSKDGRTYVRLEEILNRKKFSTFRFDFFGHGESVGEFDKITISEAVDDVQSAIRFVKDSGYERIGLVGSSFGGFASILTAGKSDDVFVLALKSPVSDYLGLLIARDNDIDIDAWRQVGFIVIESSDGKKVRLNYSFFADAEGINGYAFAENIKVPTLIVHGDNDDTVPLAQSQKTADLIRDCRLEIIEGADHTFSDPQHFELMLDRISRFIFRT